MLQRAKWVSIAAIVALIVTITVQNWQYATTKILFIEVSMPLAVLLFATFAVGWLCGMAIGNPLRWLRGRRA